MPTIVRDFTGNLNLDAHYTRMPKGDFVDSLNITRDSRDSNSDQVITGIAGNRIVPYSFQPDTTNICIGAYNDDIKNRVIYFVWNSGGYHSILNYDNATRTITKILESITDSNGIDILNFQLLYKVNNINIIHREEDGDLLLWNDAYNRPGQLNVSDFIAGVYGTNVTDDLIRLSKRPPVDEFLPAYKSDNSLLSNNFKKKLFQYCYAWGYKNGEVSTISPVSKCVLPTDAYSIDTDSDPLANNVMELPLIAGGADYNFIRIFGRSNIGNEWGNWFIIDTLYRDDYSITPGGTYTYRFLNDGQYVDADPLYMELLFDYTAYKCNAQTLVNGNVIVQGGITEGYDPILRSAINIQLTSSLIDTASNGAPSPSNPTVTINIDPGFVDYNIGASVATGDFYVLKMTWNYHKLGFPAVTGATLSVQYIANGTDTANTVANQLIILLNAQIAANYPGSDASASHRDGVPNRVTVDIVWNTQPAYNVTATATPPVYNVGASATWKWAANYRFGIVYVDENGKTNGVVSFVGSELDITDFAVTTPSFSANTDTSSPLLGNPQIPVINASINHTPPNWAVAYYWVRTPNQSTNSFLEYITSEVQEDAGYFYFCIENLNVFKEDNTGFVPSYTFTPGDRMKIYASVFPASVPFYLPLLTPVDYEILGTVERDMNVVSVAATKGLFLKIKKPSSTVSYFNTSLIEIYTPATHSTATNQVFYGFGESYGIYTDSISGIRYHLGKIQNQTASQSATFTFADGDVYYKFRDFYQLNTATGKIDPATVYSRGVMDANYNDYWASEVNSNSTPWVIDREAKRLFQPTLIRFGQAYQPGTDINGLNRFYPLDFDEYFRDYGAIMNFSIRDKMLHVYQKLRIGRVPIFAQIIKTQDGTEQLAAADKLLNPIQYYQGQFGIGDHPESLASNNYADYFVSNIRGVYCRLSQDGLIPISIQHNINNFAITELGGRDFNYKCYGVFDAYNNLYITALEATPSLPSKTIMWNEQRNGFESFLSYKPEMMVCLNQMLITFKDGQLYTHDDDANYNTFYGTQYESSITPVFNDNILEKKNWMNVTQQASEAWGMPVITTSNKTFGTNTLQNSNLLASEFEDLDGLWNKEFLQDAFSVGGIGDGNPLTGVYMIAKLQLDQPTRDSYLNIVAIEYQSSPKNFKK